MKPIIAYVRPHEPKSRDVMNVLNAVPSIVEFQDVDVLHRERKGKMPVWLNTDNANLPTLILTEAKANQRQIYRGEEAQAFARHVIQEVQGGGAQASAQQAPPTHQDIAQARQATPQAQAQRSAPPRLPGMEMPMRLPPGITSKDPKYNTPMNQSGPSPGPAPSASQPPSSQGPAPQGADLQNSEPGLSMHVNGRSSISGTMITNDLFTPMDPGPDPRLANSAGNRGSKGIGGI